MKLDIDRDLDMQSTTAQESIESLVGDLGRYAVDEGGFCNRLGGPHRPDATAWVVLALATGGVQEDLAELGRSRLVADQMKDGRVSIHADHPQAFWPTSLAVLAWHGCPGYSKAQDRAVKFLLNTRGNHLKNKNSFALGDDTSIRGWSWVSHTHSWVEPTSLVLLALELTGHGDHQYAIEARRMLLDRQLDQGGWNCGNKSVFGRQLRPMALSTGLALAALAGRVPRDTVQNSLCYLKDKIGALRTPLSLGWSVLGLGAWGERPLDTEELLFECIARQKIYGTYSSQQLSELLICFHADHGLLNLLMERLN